MAYRTRLFQFDGFKNYFLNEHFAGQLQLSGDDKCLTRLCIMSDYKMWHQICEVREGSSSRSSMGKGSEGHDRALHEHLHREGNVSNYFLNSVF